MITWSFSAYNLNEILDADMLNPSGRASFGPNFLTEFLPLKEQDVCTVDFGDKTRERENLYANGFTRHGIHYVRLGRTAGQAKNGKCVFINDKYYDKAIEICCAGIPEIELVGYEAYKSLCFSDWRGTVKINPDNIVIMKDFEGKIECDADLVKVLNHKTFYVESGKGEASYNIFDGQGLIDSEIIDEEYVSLRGPFTKCNALRCNLKQFFKDKGIEILTDIYGVKHRAEDVELVTTPSSFKWTKWEKYGYTFDAWKKHMATLNNQLGICKEPTESKLLDGYVRASYQMSLAIPADEIEDAHNTQEYIDLLADDDKFMEHCSHLGEFNPNSIVTKLDFLPYWRETKEYFEYKKAVEKKIAKDAREGRIVTTGTNLVQFGNPLKMLYMACGLDIEDFPSLDDSYACYTQAFEFGSALCGMRSPFNSPSMMGALSNVEVEEYGKYFTATHSIFVNQISTFQDRENGSDNDGDFMLVTNNAVFVENAFKNHVEMNIPINNTPKLGSAEYKFDAASLKDLDNTIASMQKVIGMTSNCAANAVSVWWTNKDTVMWETAIIQAINAQNSIDSAKRLFEVNIVGECNRLCKKTPVVSWFSKLKNKDCTFESATSMDKLMAKTYEINVSSNKVNSIMNHLKEYEEQKLTPTLHSLCDLYLHDIIESHDDFHLLQMDSNEIVLELKCMHLTKKQTIGMMKAMLESYPQLGFSKVCTIFSSVIDVTNIFEGEAESHYCIICGEKFIPKRKAQVICGCHECKKALQRKLMKEKRAREKM